MNLQDFELQKEDENSFTVGHPKGKSMTIPKRGLSDKAQKLIQKLKPVQKFDDGGAVQPELTQAQIDAVSAYNPNAQSVPPDSIAGGVDVGSLFNPSPQAQAPDLSKPDTSNDVPAPPADEPDRTVASAQSPNAPVQSAPPTAMDAATPPDLQNLAMNTGPYQQEKAANTAAASAVGAQGEAESKAIQDAQDQIDQLPTQNDILAKYKNKDDQLYQAYADKKIDPNRYWNNQGTGNKIAAGLGMLLSGMGSATTGQPNLAEKNIRAHIDNDIEAQKNDQSKSMNLWKLNQERYGNESAANIATENQLLTGVKYKLEQAASQFKGPIALANAKGLNAQIDQRLNENRLKLSLFSPTSDLDPASRVGMMERFGVIKPEQAKASLEEIKNNQDLNALSPKIISAFQKGSSRNPNTAAQGQREFEALINTTVKETEGTARQAAFKSIHDTMTPSGITGFPGENDAKMRTVKEYLASHSASPMSKAIGVDLTRYPSTRFAPATAPEIKVVNGIKYTRGPNGKAVQVK